MYSRGVSKPHPRFHPAIRQFPLVVCYLENKISTILKLLPMTRALRVSIATALKKAPSHSSTAGWCVVQHSACCQRGRLFSVRRRLLSDIGVQPDGNGLAVDQGAGLDVAMRRGHNKCFARYTVRWRLLRDVSCRPGRLRLSRRTGRAKCGARSRPCKSAWRQTRCRFVSLGRSLPRRPDG